MAGTSGAVRVMEAWKTAYETHCPDLEVDIAGGGYAMGAARVYGNHLVYGTVDIGGLSGPFFDPQASTIDGWNFLCKKSGRKTTMV